MREGGSESAGPGRPCRGGRRSHLEAENFNFQRYRTFCANLGKNKQMIKNNITNGDLECLGFSLDFSSWLLFGLSLSLPRFAHAKFRMMSMVLFENVI